MQSTANVASRDIFIKHISDRITTELKILPWSIVFQTQDPQDTSWSSPCLPLQSDSCQVPRTTKPLAAPGVYSVSLTPVPLHKWLPLLGIPCVLLFINLPLLSLLLILLKLAQASSHLRNSLDSPSAGVPFRSASLASFTTAVMTIPDSCC